MLRSMKRAAALAAGVLMLVGTLAGCGGDDGGTSTSKGAEGGTESAKAVTIGYIPWDEDIVVTYLWKHVLEAKGYDVTVQQLDVAPTFLGLSKGDVDLFFDAWLPVTHADYWEEYGDTLEDLGVWYDNASLSIAVPDYMDIESIGDLADVRDELGGKIVGIESGAGLTRVTREEAMPTYGLEDFELQTSSTQAMLTALREAIAEEAPIAVTLWHPHWAYAAFPIRDLADPEGAMGGAEQIHIVGRPGFAEDFSDLAKALADFTMTDDQLAELEDVALQQHDDAEEGVIAWIEANQEWVDSLLS